MKKLLNLLIIVSVLSIITNCKKTKSSATTSTIAPCTENKHFEGTYICTNNVIGLQGDTIKIIFNNMNSNCKSVMTIKGYAIVYNYTAASCSPLINQDYQIIDNIITSSNSIIYDNVLQLNATTNVQDISIMACNGNSLNFKKIN